MWLTNGSICQEEISMTPKDVLNAWHQAFLNKDVEALGNLYAEEAINHQVAEAPIQGKAAIKQSFTLNFR
jgi:ketosteroid isomerase-like protein